MATFKDRTGTRYGSLVVAGFAGFTILPSGKKKTIWICDCDCGQTTTAIGDNLESSNTTSCGCVRRVQSPLNRTTHGGSKTAAYSCWHAMRSRCLDANCKDYPNYGGRGIRIDGRWNDFEIFLRDVGERPSLKHTLDRKDVNGNYEPGNVRWALPLDQSRNRRRHRMVEYAGQVMPASAAAELAGLPSYIVLHRLARGTDPFRPYKPRA